MELFLIWFWLFVFELIATVWLNKSWPTGEDYFMCLVSSSLVTVLIAGIWGTVIYFL